MSTAADALYLRGQVVATRVGHTVTINYHTFELATQRAAARLMNALDELIQDAWTASDDEKGGETC